MSSLIGNAMVFAGMDEHGFACFVDSGEPAKSFVIPAPVVQVEQDTHTPVAVCTVKRGDFVRFKVGGPVWIREEYSRELKAYMFAACDDVNRTRAAKSTKTVFIGFTY